MRDFFGSLLKVGWLLFALGTAGAECALSDFREGASQTMDMGVISARDRGAEYQFGQSNLSIKANALVASYPKGSVDPAFARSGQAPIGGAQFRVPFTAMRQSINDSVGVQYRVTLADNFQFVLGGKLPGLYGGTANTGGKIPNGSDGFSLRFAWQKDGVGALYAYLPTSVRWGTIFGGDRWRLVPGQTIELAMYVEMNTPGHNDGVIAAWADNRLVVLATDIVFRSVSTLKPDGYFFSSFFGGSTEEWASPVDTLASFSDLRIFRVDLPALKNCAAKLDKLGQRRELG